VASAAREEAASRGFVKGFKVVEEFIPLVSTRKEIDRGATIVGTIGTPDELVDDSIVAAPVESLVQRVSGV
jgi:hypothetical protein